MFAKNDSFLAQQGQNRHRRQERKILHEILQKVRSQKILPGLVQSMQRNILLVPNGDTDSDLQVLILERPLSERRSDRKYLRL
jgi:hypothetical protein